MMETPQSSSVSDDPRHLRVLLSRATGLATDHAIPSVMVGLAGFEGDLLFREVVDYVVSALRVDDGVYRMTRERVVVLLTDVDRVAAARIVERVLQDFREHFPTAADPALAIGYYAIDARSGDVAAKDVLPQIFASPPKAH